MATNNAINLIDEGVVGYDGAGTFSGSPLTDHASLVGAGSNTVNNLSPANDGQLVIGSSGNDPSVTTLTPGTGLVVNNSSGSVELSANAYGMNYIAVTGNVDPMLPNTTYIITVDSGNFPSLQLPTTANFGDIFRVVGDIPESGGWEMGINPGQTVIFGSSSLGTQIATLRITDCLELVCGVTDTVFVVTRTMGNYSLE